MCKRAHEKGLLKGTRFSEGNEADGKEGSFLKGTKLSEGNEAFERERAFVNLTGVIMAVVVGHWDIGTGTGTLGNLRFDKLKLTKTVACVLHAPDHPQRWTGGLSRMIPKSMRVHVSEGLGASNGRLERTP